MQENLGYLLAVVGADAITVATAGESLSVSQIVGYLVAVLVGGGAAWKALPILAARLAVSMAGAKSEKDAIERLESQLAVERQATAVERARADMAYKERNDILRELGEVRAQLAALVERAAHQAATIEQQTRVIQDLTSQVRSLQEEIRGKTA